jgi:VIT1/CCC1 family predicted Fe2+/Mn2+ transporter
MKVEIEKYGKEVNGKEADKEKDRKKSLLAFNLGMADQGLGIIADAAGEGTALAKAAAIAQATISGVQGVQNAFTSANANIPATASSFGAYPVTMAALAGVFAAANIAKIASGGGGGVTSDLQHHHHPLQLLHLR